MAEPFTLLQPPLLFKPMLVLLQRRRCTCAFRNIQQSREHMGMLPCLILNGHRFELDRDRGIVLLREIHLTGLPGPCFKKSRECGDET